MSTLLFSPGRIGTLELKNRIVMSAMHLGLSLEREAAFLAERARGGAALATTVMGVAPGAAAAGMPVLCGENRKKLRAMAGEVHAAGGLLSVQLFHVGRNCEEGCLADPTACPVAPSPVPSPIYRSVPRQLGKEEIEEVYRQFAQAAAHCRACGVDAVEISCSAGYLLSEFLSSLTNLRTDEFGGALERRAKMPLEVIRSVREAVGADYPVILRISASDMLGGYGIFEMRQFVQWASGLIDAVNVTGGWHESPVPQISMDLPEGGFGHLAKAIRQAAECPVIVCNRINSGEVAQRLLDDGCGDFVGCARAFLADGAFAEKLQNNVPYMKCIGCNKGCIEQVLRHRPATCVFNPLVGREGFGFPVPVHEKRRILVVGGGPSGLYSARYLAQMGHAVTLCTGEDGWGGLLRLAGMPPHKQTILHNVETMVFNAKQAGVDLRTNTSVDRDYLAKHVFDFCILAEGLQERVPPIQTSGSRRVYLARELFEAQKETLDRLAGKNICIIGGGSIGVELALFLFHRMSPSPEVREFQELFVSPELRGEFNTLGRITIVEREEKIARDLGGTRWITLRQLQRFPVELMTKSAVCRITETDVEIRQGDQLVKRPADAVVLAVGYMPREDGLEQVLLEFGIPYAKAGDCMGGGGILNATRSAFHASAGYGGMEDEPS